MYKAPVERKRVYTDTSTLASCAIGGAFAGATISTLIAPGVTPLIGALIGGVAGATSVNYLSKFEYEKRKKKNQ